MILHKSGYEEMKDENSDVLSSKDVSLILNEEKKAKQEELDGYYMIITSETKLSWNEILDTYRKLWEIEASFRLTRTQFEARPIYVSKMNSIRGHFLSCYLASTITRILQKKELNGKLNAEKIIDFIRTLKAFPISNEQFLLSGSYPDVIVEIEKRYGLNFNYKTISLDKLQKLFLL